MNTYIHLPEEQDSVNYVDEDVVEEMDEESNHNQDCKNCKNCSCKVTRKSSVHGLT